ncbi:endonuclease/exonuclease/phosphatase family protein [Bizionia saleffrena]|uniref:Endonuclease/exonuclease/phosphatase family protein n=1 Tax=Bizionia saleffrena TaxID=291189 RepID=A0A8H2LCL3_9FLAO|nr:endonuclease/exonuclease/phosphatase family protein [Bizionia saleffrena]TYB69064.1 endonuclease/exonuclease/phosphatase family protein [Bizionia saleffrena]
MFKKQILFLLLLSTLFSLPLKSGAYNPLTYSSNLSETSVSTNHLKKIQVASWNIRDLGRSKTPENINQIANILRDFDVVALQEVVAKDPAGAQAVAKIADALNRMGSKWDYQISDPTNSPSVYMSERYAFLWKTSRVTLVGKAYLDKGLEKLCYREPFIATFKTKGESEPFYVVNYHSRKHYDKPEEEIIHFIDYPERLNSNSILIVGDFNINENHTVWDPFYSKGFNSALKNQPTTLKTKCKNGNYLNHSIDNGYFTSGINIIKAGKLDFVKDCKNLELAQEISDHLPIYMELEFN